MLYFYMTRCMTGSITTHVYSLCYWMPACPPRLLVFLWYLRPYLANDGQWTENCSL